MADRPAIPLEDLSELARIRLRAGMYIGGTDFFGFIQYIVSAFDVMLHSGATWIEFALGSPLRISSDARIPVRLNDKSELEPFEAFPRDLVARHRRSPGLVIPDAAVLTALSKTFHMMVSDGATQTRLECVRGTRTFLQQQAPDSPTPSITISFCPDAAIFSVTEISPTVVHSYCRRTACLHPGLTIRVDVAGEVAEYHSADGIGDFFAAVSLPYQIMHKPIRVRESQDELAVEAVFAFHSWSENLIWSFVNNGRVPDGGTHESGFLDAIEGLREKHCARTSNGILGVVAITYPHVTFEGCIKGRVYNPELQDRVRDLVKRGITNWVREDEQEATYLAKIEQFQFAESW